MKTRKQNMDGKSDTLLYKALIALVVLILLFFISCKNEPVYYEVRFNSNGGTVYTDQKVREGECVSRVADPVKEGYTFEGWYTDPEFTYKFDFNQPVYSNLTLYAKWGGSPVPTEPDYLTFTVSSGNVVSVEPSSYWNAATKQYSIDGGETWVDWTSGETPSASSVMFRGLGGSAGSSASDGDNYKKWIVAGTNVSCSGNIETILDYETVKCGGHPTMDPYCYCAMFDGCTSLETAPELPATSLAEGCYYGMFHGCSLLKTAPELPATTLADNCYLYMFRNCTSLTAVPELPATLLANDCYSYMFQNCTSLTTAPELPATTLADKCYLNMFSGCTSLTTAPELPATTLADKCYIGMFSGCTSLTTVPDFIVEKMGCASCLSMFANSGLTDASGITICDTCYDSSIEYFGCCEQMFSDCAELTKAPKLSATQHYDSTSKLHENGLADRCYSNMFQGCASLTTAPALPAITLAAYCYSGMFFDCKALTTAPELPATTLADNCYSSMFYDCKALTTAPELPATTLAANCYLNMFSGCTSLTTAPALPATQHINSTGQAENGLADWCYAYMFYGCTSLNGMTSALPATTLADYCYLQMFYGCTSLKVQENGTALPTIIFTCPNPGGDLPIFAVSYMFSGTTGTFTGTPVAGNTYYWYI